MEQKVLLLLVLVITSTCGIETVTRALYLDDCLKVEIVLVCFRGTPFISVMSTLSQSFCPLLPGSRVGVYGSKGRAIQIIVGLTEG